jgi:hypothetical protein
MARKVIATPLFEQNLVQYLDEYASLGATRFIERLWSGYQQMIDNISTHNEIGLIRKRSIGGKKITVREYLIDAGAREFLVLYWLPETEDEPILLLNIRIGGQNKFHWK